MLPEDKRPPLRTLMPAIFMELSPDRQCEALGSTWNAVKSPEMLPILLTVYNGPPKGNPPAQLYDACLRRAYQLDPGKARPLILDAMVNHREKFDSRFAMKSLLILPDKTLPELEEGWAAALQERSPAGLEVLTRLVVRYGSEKLLPRAKTAYERAAGRWACEIQSNFLAYFLRVDPAYGQEQVRFCLSARQQTRCWSSLLHDVSRQVWTPELQSACVANLMDPEPEICRSAAEALAEQGSAEMKDKVLAAIAATWTPAAQPDQQRPAKPREYREWWLVHSATEARGWVHTTAELDGLAAHVTSPEARLMVTRQRQQVEHPVVVGFSRDEDGGVEADIRGQRYQGL